MSLLKLGQIYDTAHFAFTGFLLLFLLLLIFILVVSMFILSNDLICFLQFCVSTRSHFPVI